MHPALRLLLALVLLPLGCVLATPDDLALRGAGDAGRDVAADAPARDALDAPVRPDAADAAELVDLPAETAAPDATDAVALHDAPDATDAAVGGDAVDAGEAPGDAWGGDDAPDAGDAAPPADAGGAPDASGADAPMGQDASDVPAPRDAGTEAGDVQDAPGMIDVRDAAAGADGASRDDVQDGGDGGGSAVVGYATTEWLGELYRDPTISPQVIVGWLDMACAARYPGTRGCADAQYTERDARARCRSFAGNTYLREPDMIRPALDGGAASMGLPCWTCGYLTDPMEVPTRRSCPPVQGIARTACCAP